jgi:alpha-glucosidase
LLPNIKDPQAVQAQDVCPGYKAGEVEKTAHGFTAILSLAGEPVSATSMAWIFFFGAFSTESIC